jgi:RNA polymerase sigma-70 factor (ECF subfamily)
MEFPATEWSLLTRATLNGESAAAASLAEFCRRYREPVVRFICRRGAPVSEAEDLAHDFMLHVMEKSVLRRADPARGRFRSFLIGALVRFLRDANQSRRAQKNGGEHPPLSLDELETRGVEPSVPSEDAAAFDREWALTLLHLTLEELRNDYVLAGQAADYGVLSAYLPGSVASPPYEESAAKLGQPLSAFKTEVHRLRKRFRERLQREVAATISSPEDIESEFSYLGQVLRTAAK